MVLTTVVEKSAGTNGISLLATVSGDVLWQFGSDVGVPRALAAVSTKMKKKEPKLFRFFSCGSWVMERMYPSLQKYYP